MKTASRTMVWLCWLGMLGIFWSCTGWDTQLSLAEDPPAIGDEAKPEEQEAGDEETAGAEPAQSEPELVEAEDDLRPGAPEDIAAVTDAMKPTPKLAMLAEGDDGLTSFWITAEFDEPVVGFDADDIAIEEGRIEAFLGGPLTYQLEVRRTSADDVALHVPADVAEDAAGNGNIASNELRAAFAFEDAPMRMVWNIAEDDKSITLPLPEARTEYGKPVANAYDFLVDWGDGSPMDAVTSADDDDARHVYGDAGDYTISIYGKMESFGFGYIEVIFESGESDWSRFPCRLKRVLDAGAVGWKSLEYAFSACLSLVDFSGGDFSQVINMKGVFSYSRYVVPDTGSWDTSQVTNMSKMFLFVDAEPDTGGWDVSNVTDMSSLFHNTGPANPEDSILQDGVIWPDTGRWNVSNVTTMKNMFASAEMARPETSNWDVSNVTDMSGMFVGAALANPDTGDWDVSSVTDMSRMFSSANSAYPDVSRWNVSNVKEMYGMFGSTEMTDLEMLNWKPLALEDASSMFTWAKISRTSYCSFLTALNRERPNRPITVGGSSVHPYACDVGRNLLDNGWRFTL